MDQLKYSLRSVETYAPWARHIYIVTNGQGKNYIRLLAKQSVAERLR